MRRIIISSWLVLLIQFLANASAPAVFAQPSDGQILNSKSDVTADQCEVLGTAKLYLHETVGITFVAVGST